MGKRSERRTEHQTSRVGHEMLMSGHFHDSVSVTKNLHFCTYERYLGLVDSTLFREHYV